MEQYYNSISSYLKKEFGEKTIKLSIDGGFTCPNRDGTKSFAGCKFCSSNGSGEFATNIDDQINLLSDKWPNAKYLAYFQNHTNTYASVNVLRKKFTSALSHPMISGIAISTRPDCISDEVLDYLDEINRKHFMWVELGLQSIHEKTQREMNLCYNTHDYNQALSRLSSRGIKVVSHLILGLPGETKEDIYESVKYVSDSSTWGLKLHMLNVVKGSVMEKEYINYSSFKTISEYVDLVCNLLEIIPPHIVIHRLTADAPRKILISPSWSYNKRTILNGIQHEMLRRGSTQGCKTKEILNV